MVESSNSNQMRYIKDQIHDYSTKQFQRLRYIKQLGTSYMVWPGASHNRFEHCLGNSTGVAHLARSMIEHLRDTQPELQITARDVDCVQIAGLCHDLGHGPWSHVWDGLFIPSVAPGKKWRHEAGSKMMFRYLLDDNNINTLPEKDVAFILALIDGEPSQCSADEKSFLFDIVANKRNGLDVDKFDYIARDSYMIGEPKRPRHRNEICYHIKDINQLHEICYTRFKLHKMIYNHKTAKAIEYMIIADRIEIPKKFVHLTDDIMNRIEDTEDPELEGAREIFDRVRKRDLYRFVDQRIIEWELREVFDKRITRERIVEEARRLAVQEGTDVDLTDLTPDSVIVDQNMMHYGMKEKNPLDFVKFYSKHHPNTCARAQKGEYSMLMPPTFAELYLTIFTKHPQYLGLVQAGYPPSTPTRGHSRASSLASTINENSFTTCGSIEDDERQLKRPA
ncbi:hypothetical protein B0H13DRAFT_1998218 [Mycena leptocephala]|nr:hypothetical protein B0H13DRAFT_1998218 [Mycena leptocephala]